MHGWILLKISWNLRGKPHGSTQTIWFTHWFTKAVSNPNICHMSTDTRTHLRWTWRLLQSYSVFCVVVFRRSIFRSLTFSWQWLRMHVRVLCVCACHGVYAHFLHAVTYAVTFLTLVNLVCEVCVVRVCSHTFASVRALCLFNVFSFVWLVHWSAHVLHMCWRVLAVCPCSWMHWFVCLCVLVWMDDVLVPRRHCLCLFVCAHPLWLHLTCAHCVPCYSHYQCNLMQLRKNLRDLASKVESSGPGNTNRVFWKWLSNQPWR